MIQEVLSNGSWLQIIVIILIFVVVVAAVDEHFGKLLYKIDILHSYLFDPNNVSER